MNLDISFTPEAACELLELENYLQNVPQGSFLYSVVPPPVLHPLLA